MPTRLVPVARVNGYNLRTTILVPDLVYPVYNHIYVICLRWIYFGTCVLPEKLCTSMVSDFTSL